MITEFQFEVIKAFRNKLMVAHQCEESKDTELYTWKCLSGNIYIYTHIETYIQIVFFYNNKIISKEQASEWVNACIDKWDGWGNRWTHLQKNKWTNDWIFHVFSRIKLFP